MHFTVDLNTLIGGVLLLGVSGLAKMLRDIRAHLATLNGRLGRLETWREDHAQLDNERYERGEEEHRAVWTAVDKLREEGQP